MSPKMNKREARDAAKLPVDARKYCWTHARPFDASLGCPECPAPAVSPYCWTHARPFDASLGCPEYAAPAVVAADALAVPISGLTPGGSCRRADVSPYCWRHGRPYERGSTCAECAFDPAPDAAAAGYASIREAGAAALEANDRAAAVQSRYRLEQEKAIRALSVLVRTYERVRPDPNAWPDLHLAYGEARAALEAILLPGDPRIAEASWQGEEPVQRG